MRAAVLADLHSPIVCADEQQSLFDRRLGDGEDRSEESRRHVLRDGIHAPHAIHQLELVAVDLTREIRAHRVPAVAAVIASKETVRGEVDAVVVVRAHEERGVPVPAEVFAE
jgi:hypothetical protein